MDHSVSEFRAPREGRGTLDVLVGELERLFTLEELISLAERFLSLSPAVVGGASARGSFARALVERCYADERLDALADVVRFERRDVDSRVVSPSALVRAREAWTLGTSFERFVIEGTVGESERATVYRARRDEKRYALKVLHPEMARDRRASRRFVTATRLLGTVSHPGLSRGLEAGELPEGTTWSAREWVEGETLATRLATSGPFAFADAKPILRALLEALAALHKQHLAHGDLKLENVITTSAAPDRAGAVVLVDAGMDRLWGPRGGPGSVLGRCASLKGIAPEVARGEAADASADVYAFGALAYELLTGRSPFAIETQADAVAAHLRDEPEAPSARAPRGWVARDVDDFVLSLLRKDAATRPSDAAALLVLLETLGRASATTSSQIPSAADVTALVDALVQHPDDVEAAFALEAAIDHGGDPLIAAEAFELAAEEASSGPAGDRALETAKALLSRAARLFDTRLKNAERAEKIYAKLVALDPKDEKVWALLKAVRRRLGKHDAIVEMLLERSEAASSERDRARALAEIGEIYAVELNDPDQALVAYTRALCETPVDADLAREIERLAGSNAERWTEIVAGVTEGARSGSLAVTERNALLVWAGRWYEQKLGDAERALHAYRSVAASDPENDAAADGIIAIYRRMQAWPELAAFLVVPRGAATLPSKTRDRLAEAAEIFETRLGDMGRARELYAAVIREDPAHHRAADALARIAEKTGDPDLLISILDRRAEARAGLERAAVLARLGEVYEDQKNDLVEARRRFEVALALDPNNLEALKGLDRVFNRTGRYKELLANLERQVALATTPRQKIQLWQRIASINDEEFIDHAGAAAALEKILGLDAANEAALTSIVRQYRALKRWENVAQVLADHAQAVGSGPRKIELLEERARVLADEIGAPERAVKAYEQLSELAPDRPGALEALARLRELAGDARAALGTIDALAAKATTGTAKAELLLRAARLLEARGDKDGAIARYQAAFEANPRDAVAAAALRQAWKERGDAVKVISLIESELVHADGNLAKATLYGELARVYHDDLKDDLRADMAAKRAVDLDPGNPAALLVLGDVAFAHERFLEAARTYDSLVARASAFTPRDAARMLANFMEAFGRSGGAMKSQPSLPDVSSVDRLSVAPVAATPPRLAAALEALERFAPDELGALLRALTVVFEHGDSRTTIAVARRLLEKGKNDLTAFDRASALYRLGESARRMGDLNTALGALEEAGDLDPSSPLAPNSLALVYEARGEWESAVRTKMKRLELAAGEERVDLLVEIGDLLLSKVGDRPRASKMYLAALEDRPDDRKLLTKLMQVYSEEKEWARLIGVVVRLAEFVEDPKQRAKYIHTAAIVSHRQLGDAEQALTFYERAIAFDPSFSKGIDEAIEIARAKGDSARLEKLLMARLRCAKNEGDAAAALRAIDILGALYEGPLGAPEKAIEVYEVGRSLEPENDARLERLAELYAGDVSQHLAKAAAVHAAMLRKDPYRKESYQRLRRLYTEARLADASWCLCQALTVMKMAEPDEERFYLRHRAQGAAHAKAVLGEAEWADALAHPNLDPIVTAIFALIEPTILRLYTKPLAALGYDPSRAIDTTRDPSPLAQMLNYAHGVLGLPKPLVFRNEKESKLLGYLDAQTPAVTLGRAALGPESTPQVLACVVGRHMTSFRPGYYIRHLVPTGAGLKAWLLAAIRTCVPPFPVTPDLDVAVKQAMTAIAADLDRVGRDKLALQVNKLVQAGKALDLKNWIGAVDLTADRAGLLLSHDLASTTEVIRALENESSVPARERMKEIVLFSVSDPYFSLRDKLGIRIDS
jgi:tetratricopeptide (TPR) repeat protein/tRNA A-37 threonylcarbamoyl transferase component Bud32